MNKDVFLHGNEHEPTGLINLCAGPLRLLFDPLSGFVRHIRNRNREVLRGIYAAVRDQNWGTVTGVLRDLRIDSKPNSFSIHFTSEHKRGGIDFVWLGRLAGSENGSLSYEFEGEARCTFKRNRIGFCVLHPLESAGAAARQIRSDGSVIECAFPKTIEPQVFGKASFRDLRAVAHEVSPALWAQLEFEGDVFEMEDQRNWTDASFKTYCTPLALPFPVEIAAGTKVKQRVAMRLHANENAAGSAVGLGATSGSIESSVAEADNQVRIVVPLQPANPMPALGLGSASHANPLTDSEADRLRSLGIERLRVDLKLSSPDWSCSLERAATDARRIGAELELAVHLPPDGEPALTEVAENIRRIDAPLGRVLALREGEPATTRATLAAVKQHLGSFGVPVGSGSDCNFCELNRELALGRFALDEADFVFWPINPQVHAFDNLSITETLEAQAHTVSSIKSLSQGKPLAISPVTFKQRFNPVATAPEQPPPPGELPTQVDLRQLSLFGAGWTLGSIAALACPGVDSITYFETTGWRGVTETDAGSLLPEKFPSSPGQVFPIFRIFAEVNGFSGVAPLGVDKPLEVAALALFKGQRLERVLAANLTGSILKLSVSGLDKRGWEPRMLSERAGMQAGVFTWTRVSIERPASGELTLELPRYAVVLFS
jgi:D-apionolactonase